MDGSDCVLTALTDVREFDDAVRDFLMASEAEYCVPIGLIEKMIRVPSRFPRYHLAVVRRGDEVAGAVWMTPPHGLGLTRLPSEAIKCVVEFAESMPDRPASVFGPTDTVDRFLERWAGRSGCRVAARIEQRLYALTRVIAPPASNGHMRACDHADQPLLEAWNMRFTAEVGIPSTAEEARQHAAEAIEDGSRYVWIEGDRAVSMAGFSGDTPNGVRINWVSTPEECRGRGYASNLVAAVSQMLLDRGKRFCYLYTDLANPTSNAIYQRIGYEPVCDGVLCRLEYE